MLTPRFLADQLERTYSADPWYGPDTKSLLADTPAPRRLAGAG
jgi:hypothetical protein